MHTQLDDKNASARQKLRDLKARWDIGWDEMGKVLAIPPSSLRVYASHGEYVPDIPRDRIERILALDEACPDLDNAPSGTLGIFLQEGVVYVMEVPEVRLCLYCKKPFIPGHPQQAYCTTYIGECGLAMRRKRRSRHEQTRRL